MGLCRCAFYCWWDVPLTIPFCPHVESGLHSDGIVGSRAATPLCKPAIQRVAAARICATCRVPLMDPSLYFAFALSPSFAERAWHGFGTSVCTTCVHWPLRARCSLCNFSTGSLHLPLYSLTIIFCSPRTPFTPPALPLRVRCRPLLNERIIGMRQKRRPSAGETLVGIGLWISLANLRASSLQRRRIRGAGVLRVFFFACLSRMIMDLPTTPPFLRIFALVAHDLLVLLGDRLWNVSLAGRRWHLEEDEKPRALRCCAVSPCAGERFVRWRGGARCNRPIWTTFAGVSRLCGCRYHFLPGSDYDKTCRT